MAWIRSNKKGSGGGSTTKLWIFNPSEADAIKVASAQTGAYIPYITQIKNASASGYPNMYGNTNFGGTTLNVIQRGGIEIGAVTIPIKVPHGIYDKLYANVQVVADGTSWLQAGIMLVSQISFDGNGKQTDVLKEVTLVNNSKTSEWINSQSGVTINSTNPTLLSAQTVEVDISGLTSDFYFGWWNCDRRVSFRSVYFE